MFVAAPAPFDRARSPARILVVDDELNIRSSLTRSLRLLGYQAEGAGSGPEALGVLKETTYDLMILDIAMPGMYGTEVLVHARHLRPDLLIIILTGNATLESAIAAVKSDAIDYLLKPVKTSVLATAIAQALQRRTDQLHRQHLLHTAMQALQEAEGLSRAPEADAQPTPPAPGSPSPSPAAKTPSGQPTPGRFVQIGSLILDRHKRLFLSEGMLSRPKELTKGEADVLGVLMAFPNQVLTSRDLVRAAWGYQIEEAEARSLVRPYISRLRQKIENSPDKPHLIQTVRGSGYLLNVT